MAERDVDLSADATRDLSTALTLLLADMFALYLKIRNFSWHMSGPYSRDYRHLLDEHSAQVFATTEIIAGRARKIGGTTLRSISHVARLQRIIDNDAEHVAPRDMLAELGEDNRTLARSLRQLHGLCVQHGDIATAGLLATWLDEAENRTSVLFEVGRPSS